MELQNQNIVHIWQRILCLLSERIIAFRKILLYNRRRTCRRIREKQRNLQFQYIHRLMDLQNQFILKLPHPVMKNILWEEMRNPSAWNLDELSYYDEDDWLNNFRVSKKTFKEICDIVRPDLTPRVPANRNPVPLEKRVAIALLKIATGVEYKFISNRFNVARSTACKFLKIFCDSLNTRLGDKVIYLPDKMQEILEINREFKKFTNLPLMIGVLDLIHVPINATTEVFPTLVNNAGWSSIVLQAVVDHKLLFRKIEFNSRDSSLFVDDSSELPKLDCFINNQPISCYLAASESYPLKPWLIKKYSVTHCNEEKRFNENIDKALHFPHEAFRRLLSRFRVLSNKADIECKTMTSVISTCCILQNLIEKNHDGYKEKWFEEMNKEFYNIQPKVKIDSNGHETQDGKEVRRLLTSYLK